MFVDVASRLVALLAACALPACGATPAAPVSSTHSESSRDARGAATESKPSSTACGADALALVRQSLDGALPIETIYPRIGMLRGDLLACQADPVWRTADHRKLSPALWARMWLAMWSDPHDDAVVEQFMVERRDIARAAPAGVEGATSREALQNWVENHFTREGFPKPESRTHHSMRVLEPPGAGRALGLFEVRYAHWGYSMEVIAVERASRWKVRFTISTEHWHGD